MSRNTARLRLAGFAAATAFALSAVTGVAHAAGTDAGLTIDNTFTLDYRVSGTPQTQINNTGSPTQFTVDRIVDLTVTSQGDTNVAPGASAQELVFGVRNDGNDTQAYEFDLKDVGGDDFDATGVTVRYYTDVGADGLFTPGVDDAGAGVAYAPAAGVGPASADLAPDATLWVVVSGNIPGGQVDGDTDGVTLIANSLDPTAWLHEASATPGSETAGDTGANDILLAAQNVLADGGGTAGAPEDDPATPDGAHSDTGSFIVASADLTASKAVSVIATDGAAITCATDPVVAGNQYASPGACIEYVITAANDAGASATATNIDIGDTLPDQVQFVGAVQSGFSVAGALTPPTGGCTTSCAVTLTGAELAIGATGTLTIRALVR